MTVDPDAPPEPLAPATFDQLPLPEALRAALREMGYLHPTPVQEAALGPALAGKDLVVQARTGTGKTAAFGLPLLSGRVRSELDACQALILVPTRELALQVRAEIERLSRNSGIGVRAVYGGAPIGKQIDELARGAHIVVATPGRMLDHIERRTIDLGKICAFVLDECDEMLSMGFLPQINAIWERLPRGHQTLLFSATVPKDVSRIANTRLTEPEFITLSGDHIGALEIQHFVYLSQGDKLSELLRILETENPESAIVFCNTKDETKRVAKELSRLGYSADWLNADLSQSEREKVMVRTRAGQLRFMVCTDVAARGIDISHLTHVINFDFPDSSEQYVHRTGRTGRAGKIGTAISLVAPDSLGDLYYLRLKFKIQPIERRLPSERELLTRKEADLVRVLLLRFPRVPVADEFRSLARRIASHEDGESIFAGLLRRELDADAADSAAEERRAKNPPGVAPAEVRNDRPQSNRETIPGPSSAPRLDGVAGRSRRRRRQGHNAFEPEVEHEEEGFRYTTSDAPVSEPEPETPRTETASRAETSPLAERRPDGAHRTDTRFRSGEPRGRAESRESTEARRGAEPRGSAQSRSDVDGEIDGAQATDGSFVNLFVNVGRRDGATPEVLKTALAEAGVVDTSTGRIAIRERHSYVEVRPELGQRVIESLHGSKLCGRDAVVEIARPRGAAG